MPDTSPCWFFILLDEEYCPWGIDTGMWAEPLTSCSRVLHSKLSNSVEYVGCDKKVQCKYQRPSGHPWYLDHDETPVSHNFTNICWVMFDPLIKFSNYLPRGYLLMSCTAPTDVLQTRFLNIRKGFLKYINYVRLAGDTWNWRNTAGDVSFWWIAHQHMPSTCLQPSREGTEESRKWRAKFLDSCTQSAASNFEFLVQGKLSEGVPRHQVWVFWPRDSKRQAKIYT
jgi:hypothetical protein